MRDHHWLSGNFSDRCLRFRSRSQARRFSIIEVSAGRVSCPVETALAAIASSSLATALAINSTGIPLPCISKIISAIGVFTGRSPRIFSPHTPSAGGISLTR